jgi:hypothetical protein
MKSMINISATVDKPELLESLVAKLAIRRGDHWIEREPDSSLYEVFETSTTQTFISGTMMFNEGYELLHIPFTTPFIFSCNRDSEGNYKVACSQSLS